MMPRRRAWLALVFASLLGCEGRFGYGERDVVAWVGDEPIRKAELEAYLADNLLSVDEKDAVTNPDPTVASRLLDALVDQKLLWLEAQRTGIEVSDVEIAVYVGEATDGSGHATPTPAEETRARQRLMIEKLQEHVVRSLAMPTDEEVAAWATSERERLLPERPVELRALQLPSRDVAATVREDLRQNRMSFDEAIVAHEPSPGQTVTTRVSWDHLPPGVQQSLEGLDEGGISEPVELHGRVYLFQIVAWNRDPGARSADLQTLARHDLEEHRRDEALVDLVRELRQRTEIRIRASSLPFAYSEPVDGPPGHG